MNTTPAHPQQCQATRRDGTPCRTRATASGYCFAHDPTALANRAKGGHNRSNTARAQKAMPERLKPIAQLLEASMAKTFAGTMKPQQATALAALAGAYCRVVQVGEMEERLRALEAALTVASA